MATYESYVSGEIEPASSEDAAAFARSAAAAAARAGRSSGAGAVDARADGGDAEADAVAADAVAEEEREDMTRAFCDTARVGGDPDAAREMAALSVVW